jgi:hypothetical protein
MADRYWVGGTGTWSATNTANWSTSSGGSGGASVPTSADNAQFLSTSAASAYVVTVSTSVNCSTLILQYESLGNSLTFSGVGTINVYGNLTCYTSSDINVNVTLNFRSTTSGREINAFGNTLNGQVIFDGVGGAWAITRNTNVSNTVSLVNGTLNLNTYSLTTPSFDTSNSNTRTLNFGTSGSINVSGSGATAFNCSTSTGLTVSGTLTGTSINMTSASAKTFAGGGKTWPGISNQGGGALTITGANTFAGPCTTSAPATYTFQSGVTQTFTSSLNFSGTAVAGVTLNSTTAGTQATLSQAAGLGFSAGYVNVKDSNATGGQTWVAVNSIDAGNNTGWFFIDSSGGSMMMFC